MTNPELIEAVAEAIRTSKDAGAFFNDWRDWEHEAIAAIAAVRAYDVEHGPSVEEVARGYMQSSVSRVDDVKKVIQAAAAERQRRDGEGAER